MWTTRRCLGRVCSVWPDDFRANYTIRWFFCYRLEGHDLLNNMLRRLYCLKNKWMKRQELVRFICFRMRGVKKKGVFANIKKNVLILVAEFLTSLSLMPVDFCSLLSSWVDKIKWPLCKIFCLMCEKKMLMEKTHWKSFKTPYVDSGYQWWLLSSCCFRRPKQEVAESKSHGWVETGRREIYWCGIRLHINFWYCLGPLFLYIHCLTLILAGISNYINYKVWDEITYPFPNFNGGSIEDMNG